MRLKPIASVRPTWKRIVYGLAALPLVLPMVAAGRAKFSDWLESLEGKTAYLE